MSYDFLLPSSYNPLEFIKSPRLAMRADEARWFINTIVRKMVYRDVDIHGFARLHWNVLCRVMERDTLSEIIEAHVEGGAIETSPYRVGDRSTGYRLSDRFLSDRHVRVRAIDPRLLGRLECEHSRLAEEQVNRRKPIHESLNAAQQGLSITPIADQILESLPPRTRLCQEVLVSNIRRRTFPFSVSSPARLSRNQKLPSLTIFARENKKSGISGTGRCFNALTGLKRELRTAILLDGEPLGSIDLSCAQPALLAFYIWLQIPSSGPKWRETYKQQLFRSCPWLPRLSCCEVAGPAAFEDFLLFRDLVCRGAFYDELARLSGLDRPTVKRRFLVDVLAKDGWYPSEVEQVFRTAFPSVFHVVREVNRANHANLIRLLQRLEAWLVIETVAPRLVESVPIVTLHDCIFARIRDLPLVEAAFRETFEEMGFSLTLKREIWLADEAIADPNRVGEEGPRNDAVRATTLDGGPLCGMPCGLAA